MKSLRFAPVAIGIVAALLQTPLLFAQAEVDFTALGSGSLTLQTAGVEGGSLVSLETDLPEIAAIVVEDTAARKELVRVETARNHADFQVKRLGKPEAEVVVEAESISGHFDHRIAYDLSQTRTLKITVTLNNGLEFPFTIFSRSSLANRRVTQTFNNKTCQTITLTCGDGCSTSKICCTVAFCADCISCTITCGAVACGGGGGGGGCFSAGSVEQQTLAFSLDRDRHEPAIPKSSFVLHRTEQGADGLSYLMEEWALLTLRSKPRASVPEIEVLAASSPEYAAAAGDLSRAARSSWKSAPGGRRGSSETILVVEAPIHPNNSRLVADPDLQVADSEIPAGIAPATALIRADFGEDEVLQRLQVLRVEGAAPSDVSRVLQDRLQLHRNSTKHHRTVVFARVEIDRVIRVTTLATILPKCCCNGIHCI